MNILITGINGLLGKAIGSHYIKLRGYKVIGVDIHKRVIDNEICNEYYQVNVASLKEVEDLGTRLASSPVEVLINAHQYKPQGFLDADLFTMDFEMWKSIIDVNLSGTYLTSRLFAKNMVRRNSGCIINFASTYAVVSSNPDLYESSSMGNPIAYSASKGGVIALTRYLSAYLGRYGVRANCITPHGVSNNHEQAFVDRFSVKSPLKRLMEPDEIIPAIDMLIHGTYVTGTNIMVDGGWTAW